MGRLGIFDEEMTRWIQFDEDTEVFIRFVGKEDLRKIFKKAERTAKLTGADSTELSNRELGRLCVMGWRKIDEHDHPGLIIKGKPLQFSPDNIDMLMKRSLDFSRFVNENAIDSRLFLEEEEEKKVEIKNS